MFAVVYIPNFLLQAVLRHEADGLAAPVALIDPASPGPEILQCNTSAANCGVVPGLTASQAMARCEKLRIKPRSPALEKSAAEILLQTAYAFSPRIEATGVGVCTMELRGLALQTENALRAWSGKILQNLWRYRLEAKIGIAPTPSLAWLAARGAESIAIAQKPDEFIARLPVAALEPSAEILEILSRWGIRLIGQFIALGRDNVATRLGPEALELFERVSPNAIRPLQLIAPPEEFSEEMEFENEVETAAPLLFVLRRFVEQLSQRLALAYLVVAEFYLRLGLSSGAYYERVFKIPSPTGNIETLFRMLQTHLETVRTDSGIISVALKAIPAAPEPHQFTLFESTLRDPNQFADTFARLLALLGPKNVGVPVLENSHKPDSFRMNPANFDAPPPRPISSLQKSGLCLRRLRPPAPAHFEFRGERPALIRSEIFTGAITSLRGPYFSSGQWWDDRRWAREEWDVETSNGSCLRIFRSGDGCFVEGVYD